MNVRRVRHQLDHQYIITRLWQSTAPGQIPATMLEPLGGFEHSVAATALFGQHLAEPGPHTTAIGFGEYSAFGGWRPPLWMSRRARFRNATGAGVRFDDRSTIVDVDVRRAVESDASRISSVLRAAFAEYEPIYTAEGFEATTPDPEAVLERMREGPVWVAVRDDDMIGTVAAVCEDGECYVRGMGVAPDSRASGVGSLLLQKVENHAVRQGARRMYLSTTPFLDRAIRLYERFGFRRSDEGPLDVFGTPLFTMMKRLRED